MSETTITFSNVGDFQGMYAAEKWCEQNGYSVGSSQKGSPRDLMKGDWVIAKWRNLQDHHRARLDGTMTGDKRNGPVTVRIKVTGEQS